MLQLNITQGKNEDIPLQPELIEKEQLRMMYHYNMCSDNVMTWRCELQAKKLFRKKLFQYHYWTNNITLVYQNISYMSYSNTTEVLSHFSQSLFTTTNYR